MLKIADSEIVLSSTDDADALRAQYKSDLDALRRKVQSLRGKLYHADQMLSRGEVAGFVAASQATDHAIEISKAALEVLLVRDRLDVAEAGDE